MISMKKGLTNIKASSKTYAKTSTDKNLNCNRKMI